MSHSDASIAARVRHVEALLEERGLVDAQELDRALEAFLANAKPANGKRIVARAWADTGFKARLLENANTAIEEIGLSMGGGLQQQTLKVVENTPEVHNVIVCTLCSCYPIALLGPSPAWYKSPAYRSRVVRDPRGVLAEFGFDPEGEIAVWDASAETRYLVLPRRPAATEGWDEQRLAEAVTRNGLIGTAPV
ncbi:nitrile hydratase subunit alpha [Lentzea sp. NBRC 105346]|uniref:nitrile hydratase subunit alpha n=1 Tax=Lentzea sp. NBRC 105346 TaxID=3032205 RepID=UPI0024A173A8|nr:nitrile hydratase subunit alpha [Lentzea sp. NBRC 105346]GLZ29059.1 nitrile hydratase subunit alpha [Lentzea sp. NBRC 105346]